MGTVDNPSHQAARAARVLLRQALRGALATLDHRSPGRPYVSLVLIATEPDGTPITLISGLALHTRNLAADLRSSLLLDATAGLDDPMTGARLTLTGHAAPSGSGTALARFLARHPAASAYAELPDFRPFAFHIEAAHYIGGFGRIVDLSPPALATDVSDADGLVGEESGLIAEINVELRETLGRYASGVAGAAGGDWKVSGLDPEGADLLHRSNTLRVDFPARVRTAAEAKRVLGALLAKGASGSTPDPT